MPFPSFKNDWDNFLLCVYFTPETLCYWGLPLSRAITHTCTLTHPVHSVSKCYETRERNTAFIKNFLERKIRRTTKWRCVWPNPTVWANTSQCAMSVQCRHVRWMAPLVLFLQGEQVSIAVRKILPTTTWEKCLFHLIVIIHHENSGQEFKAGTCRQELKPRSWRNAGKWHAQLFLIQPRAISPEWHSTLGPPTSIPH